MVLHVDGSIAAMGCGDEDVGLSDASACIVGGQSAGEDEWRAALHRPKGCRLCVRAVFGDKNCVAMQRCELGEDLGFEVATGSEEPFLKRCRRKRLSRHDQVILCPDRALLGDVAPLERDRRDVEARRQSWPHPPALESSDMRA